MIAAVLVTYSALSGGADLPFGPAGEPAGEGTSEAAPGAPSIVRLAVPAMDLNHLLPLAVAERLGLFKEEALEVQVDEWSTTAARNALLRKDLEIGCHTCAIGAALRDAPLQVVFSTYNTSTFQLVVNPLKVRQPHDLAGQAIAIATPRNPQDVATRLMLQSLGVDPGSPTYVALGGEAGRSAGLLSGQMAVSAMTPEGALRLKRQGMSVLAGSAPLLAIPTAGYGVHVDYVREHRPTLQRWLRAMVQALVFIRQDPLAAADFAASVYGIEREVAREAVPFLVEAIDPDDPGGWTEQGLQELVRISRDSDPELRDRDAPLDRIADVQPLREVQRQLGIECRDGAQCR
jgi:NitT/TauT family transport system substrate-binding protein